MNFTVSTISKSLADYLVPYFPGAAFYEDPNQQGTKCPCLFLQVRYNYLTRETSGFWRRRLGLDLTYLVDYNLPNMQQLYQQAGEQLDLVMETFLYSDGEASSLVRTHEREWRIDLDALHYQFEIVERVKLPEESNPIQSMNYRQEVVEAEKVQ